MRDAVVRASRLVCAVLAGSLIALPAWGDGAGHAKGAKGKKSYSYAGVTKVAGEPPPITEPPPKGLQYLTWPGFKVDKDKSVEIFLQLTGPVTYEMKQRGRRVTLTLNDTVIHKKNSLRVIHTRGFPGAVKRFQVKQKKGNKLQLRVALRRNVKPKVNLATRGKYSFLSLTFPPVAIDGEKKPRRPTTASTPINSIGKAK